MFLSVAMRVPLKKARGIPRKEKEKEKKPLPSLHLIKDKSVSRRETSKGIGLQIRPMAPQADP